MENEQISDGSKLTEMETDFERWLMNQEAFARIGNVENCDDTDFFTAQMTIDAGMWMMHEISNKNGANWNWDTGEGAEFRVKQEDAEQVEVILVDIIEAQRFLAEDPAENEAFLLKVREMIKNRKGGQ